MVQEFAHSPSLWRAATDFMVHRPAGGGVAREPSHEDEAATLDGWRHKPVGEVPFTGLGTTA